MQKNVETELKLVTAKTETLDKLFALESVKDRLAPGSFAVRQLESRYYDTAKRRLAKAGVVFRVRGEPGGFVATAKTENKNSGGLSERLEYSVPLPDGKPDLTAFAGGLPFDLPALADKEGRLEELFSISVERRQCRLAVSGQTTVEMAVDTGEIRAGKKTAPVAEVEFEIISGRNCELLSFVAELTRLLPLFSEWRSKYYRGCRLAGEKLSRAAGGEIAPLAKKKPLKANLAAALNLQTGAALSAVADAALRDGGKEGRDALTRELTALRQLLACARPALAAAEYVRQEQKLAQLLTQVQTAALLNALDKRWRKLRAVLPGQWGTDALGALLAEKKKERRAALGQALAEGRYTAVLFELWAWLDGQPWADDRQPSVYGYGTLLAGSLSERLRALRDSGAADGLELREICDSLAGGLRLWPGVWPGEAAKLRKSLAVLLPLAEKRLRLTLIGNILFSLFKPSDSRLVYRDAGMLYGSYWQECAADVEALAAAADGVIKKLV